MVPPVRSTVKEKLVVPLLPSRADTASDPAAKVTVWVSVPATVKAVVGNGRSGVTVSIDWSPLPSWNTQLAGLLMTEA